MTPRLSRAVRLLGIALLGLLAAIVIALLVLQRPQVATRVTNAVLHRIPVPAGSTLRVGEVRGDWITHLELRDLRWTRDGRLVAGVDTLRASYQLSSLLARNMHVRELWVAGIRVTADIASATPPADTAQAGPPTRMSDVLRGRFYRGLPIRIDRVTIRDARYGGRASAPDSGLHLEDIAIAGRDLRLGGRFDFLLDSLAVRALPRGISGPGADLELAAALQDGRLEARELRLRSAASRIEAHGAMALDSRDSLAEVRFDLRTEPLALSDLDVVVPGLGLEGTVVTHLDVRGPRLDQLAGTISATIDSTRFRAFAFGPSKLDATLSEGRAETHLIASYQGVPAEVSGWIRPLDRTPTYELEVRSDRLPFPLSGTGPAVPERAQSAVTVRINGSGYAHPLLNVVARVNGNAGRVDLDGHIDFTPEPAREFEWVVQRLVFEELDLARLAGDSTASAFSGTLTANGRGRTPRMTAVLDLGPSRYGTWRIEKGNAHAQLDSAGLGAALRVETDGGNLEIDSVNARWDGIGMFRLQGARFSDVDLARISGNPALASRLTGTLSGQGRGLTRDALAAFREGRASAEARLDLERSQFRGQEVVRGTARLSLAQGALQVTGNLESPAGQVDLGDIRARPFDTPPTYSAEQAEFANVDLSAWTGVAALRSNLSGSLTGARHDEEWQATLGLLPSRLGGVDLAGETKASLSGGRLLVSTKLHAESDTLSAQSEVTFRDGIPQGHAELDVPFVALAGWMGRDSLKSTGRIEARASFDGLSPATATIEGQVAGSGSIGQARLDSLLAVFHLRSGTLEIDTLAVRSNAGIARGSGHVALFDSSATTSSNFRLAAAVTDLSPLRSVLGADSLAIDSGTFDATLGGSAVDRNFDLRASLRYLIWNRVRLLSADVSAQGDLDRAWRPANVTAQASLRRLRGLGVPVSEGAVRATLHGDTTEFDLSATLDERDRVHAAGRSLMDSLGVELALDTLHIVTDSTAWSLARPSHVALRKDQLVIDDFELRSANGHLIAHGHADRRGDQDLRIEMQNVTMGTISRRFGRENLTGTLNGDLALEGPATTPNGNGNVRLDLMSGANPVGSLRSSLDWKEGRLDFDGEFITPGGDSLGWTGRLPLRLSLAPQDSGTAAVQLFEGEVDVRVAADRFPLRAFSPFLDARSVGPLEGTLDVDAQLRGSRAALAGTGNIDVTAGVIPLPGLGVKYRELEFHGTFEEDRLVLHRAGAASGKGSLDLSGSVRFVSANHVEPTINVKARSFVFVDSRRLRVIASGDIDVAGRLQAPVARGKLNLEESSFELTPHQGAAGSDVQLTTADMRMMEETFGSVETRTASAPLQLYKASDLELAVTLQRDNWVRQRVKPQLSLPFTGEFTLRKAPGEKAELFGRIEPIAGRGSVEQFARSFDISGGEVLLNGKMKDHTVDIQAKYQPRTDVESDESDAVVNLEIEGRVDKLSLTMSSEPPMSEAEIVNYIITGRSANPAASSSGSGDESSLARDIGLSQLTGPAEQAAREAVGLDVLRVRYDALQGATLVAGRYIDPELYVGFRQPLQYKDTGTAESGSSQETSYEVEYAIERWLVLNLQGQTSEVRSFIRARHGF